MAGDHGGGFIVLVMKSPAILFAVVAGIIQCCHGEGVPLENGRSPDGVFEVVLEADKDTPGYEKRYGLVGEADAFPAYLIRRVKNGKVLARIQYPGDSQSDERPLRAHTKIWWSPKSNAVAIDSSERFHSYTTIGCLSEKTGLFREVPFPNYKALTGRDAPKTDDLKPRGHDWVERWTKEGNLVWRILLSPSPLYQSGDPMNYRITLGISAKGMKVTARETVPRED